MVSFKEFISESIEDRGIFKAVFIVGIPGSGKSYTGKKISGAIQPRIVNTDIATEFLTKRTGNRVNSMNWKAFEDYAHKITKATLTNYLSGMLPLIIDGTSGNAEAINSRVNILKSIGYDVGMIYVDTSLETALKRAAQREERDVDPEFIEYVHRISIKNVEELKMKQKFGYFKSIKNDDGELTDAVLVKAFKEMTSFFDSPVENEIGKEYLQEIRSKKLKMLTDIIGKDEIKAKVEGWYV